MSSRFIPNSFQVPNAVIDELMCKLSGAEFKCYMLVVRQTTGWNKQEDAISIAQMMERCNLSNRGAIDACEKLVQLGLLVKSKGYRGMNVYSVNFDAISTCEVSSPVNSAHSTCEISSQVPVNSAHTQNNNNQNTNTKNHSTSHSVATSRKTIKFSDDDLKTANWIFGLLQKLNPAIKIPDLEKWANEVRLMREVDEHSHREICELFQWANRDSFWKANILSPKKLREKWDQLAIKKSAQRQPASWDFVPDDNGDWADGMTITIKGQ